MKKEVQKRVLIRKKNFLLRVILVQEIYQREYPVCEKSSFIFRHFIENNFFISYRTYLNWLCIPAKRDLNIINEKLKQLKQIKK